MKALILIVVVLLAGCTDANTAAKALADAGYTNIHTGGHAWFQCGHDDDFATEFTATNPAGNAVSGAVCNGWLKGATIRF